MRVVVAVVGMLTISAAPPTRPVTYLASIDGIRLRRGEVIEGFSINTWGVEFKGVCHIPNDWEVTAGSFGPGGKLDGKAGHGASALDAGRLGELRELVLIRLSNGVQRQEKRDPTGVVPATFSGSLNVQNEIMDRAKKARITYANVTLVRADRCPLPRQ